MRFTRFPRGEQPNPPSARRVAAAKRAVQAEKDRYPLFPELVRYPTTESRLEAMQSIVSLGGNSTAIMSPQAGVKLELPLDHYRPAPAPGSSDYWQTCSLPGHLSTSLACCTTTEQGSAVFGTPWPNCADSNDFPRPPSPRKRS
jgi:hypothetical protein